MLLQTLGEEEIDGNTRTVLRFHPRIAPVKIAVFPLLRKDGHPEKAREVYQMLRSRYYTAYDDGGNIGRRYRRQDEIGTPICLTIDHQTLEDQTVTMRNRDTLEQRRIAISDLRSEMETALGF